MAFPVLAVGSALHLTSREPRVYRAAATVAVMPSPDITNPADVMRGLETLERRTIIATFASMAGTYEARYAAADRLGLKSSDMSGYRVDASVLPSTNIIRVTVQGGDGDRVSALANELVDVLAEQALGMYRVFEMRPLEAAQPAGSPFHPDPARNSTTAGIVGLFCGLLLALLLEFIRSRRTPPMTRSAAARSDAPPGQEPLAAAWGGARRL